MYRYKQGENSEQLKLELFCFDEMLTDDSQVRAIDIIVESMDILSMGFEYSETKETRQKPFDPKDMFKLYSYSYFNEFV